jgi:riboflavin synthase
MFTGLIAEVGTVESVEAGPEGARLAVRTSLARELEAGDSIAVDGVCLTVAERREDCFGADVMNQTLSLTSLGSLRAGGRVNLEPPLRASDRLGGHIVQGHVDGRAQVASVREDGFARRLAVRLPPELRPYVAEHGSIALDGVSLTVAALDDAGLAEVSLIPETLERTTLGEAREGGLINVEVDLIARYAERLLQGFEERKSADA